MGITSTDVSRVVGTDEVVELEPLLRFSKQTGMTTVRRFVGPRAKVRDKFNALTGADTIIGDNFSFQADGKAARLEIEIYDDAGGGGGGYVNLDDNAVWELEAEEVLKPIEQHEDFNQLSGDDKRKIYKAVRANDPLPAGTGSDAQRDKLAAYYSHQINDYLEYALVLRRTLVCTTQNTVTQSYTGINTVVSLPANAPTELLGSLPATWEWLYRRPRVADVGRGRFRLTVEWMGVDKWAKIYGGTFDPENPSA